MDVFELTTQQRNIWNLQKYYRGSAISNICGVIIYDSCRDIDILVNAVRKMIHAHAALRLRFSEKERVYQYLSEEEVPVEIRSFTDESELDAYASMTAGEPMELIDSPMSVFTVFRLGSRSGIIAKLNHLVADAWTFGLMTDSVNDFYQEESAGTKRCDHLKAVEKGLIPDGYLVYVKNDDKYLSSEKYLRDEAFWHEKYPGTPEECRIRLTDNSRDREIEAKRLQVVLSPELSERIRQLCRCFRTTETVVFESAVLLYLSRINPENRTVTIGIPVLNRNNLIEKKTAGMFVSTMPLVIDSGGIQTVHELLDRVSAANRELFRHQRYPFDSILRDIRNNHDFTGNLFDVMVSVRSSMISGDQGYRTKWYMNGFLEVPLFISIDRMDLQGVYSVTLDYQTAVFPDESEATALWERMELILSQFMGSDTFESDVQTGIADLPLSEVNILPEREKHLLLYEFNDTHVDYPRERCVHELFGKQAALIPEVRALLFQDHEYTYRELDEMSDALAWRLRERGVGRNEVIPIIAKRDWRIVVAMLAVLKAGGAYMPVSPDYPPERIRTMLEIAGCRTALCYGYHEELPVDSIDLSAFDFGAKTLPVENMNRPGDLCYIIFTSGSTGKPKGVSITHANVCNYACRNSRNVVNGIIQEGCQTIVSVTNIVFDIFVTESLLPLLNGMTICMADDMETMSQTKLAAFMEKHKPSVIQTTPTKMRSYLMKKDRLSYLSCLKAVVMGGEAFPSELYSELRRVTDARIYNIYGPAETTVWSSFTEVRNTDNVTIGRPIANTQIYILDSRLELLPAGIAGELCIAGEGVGKGYLNQPELTSERFVPNPFASEENGQGKVLYRTGDLARWRMDGEIEFLGRIDTQVKIRGLRIELGEIESVMAETEGTGLVAVSAGKDETGRQYLVGYYTTDTEVDEKAMREHLAEKLPKYMIPNYFLRLDKMPMTPSGKTDRKNLPLPELKMDAHTYVPPENDLETRLCELLAEILRVDRVGVTDDFFADLGGDSLAAISYIASAHEAGVEISLQDIFDHPTVRDLTGHMESGPDRRVSYDRADFLKYEDLLSGNRIDESKVFHKKSLGNVLLTGATGFLGAHILDEYMRTETGKLYCLVRAKNREDAESRLTEILDYYFEGRYHHEIGRSIIVVPGDIEQPGLSDDLHMDVQTVIHTAATVKHYGPWEYFHRINTEGTRHVTEYVQRAGAELIHISTISVSGNSLAEGMTAHGSGEESGSEELLFGENDYYIGQPLDNVYVRSKFEAERIVLDAIQAGLKARIIRIGNLTNRFNDLKFQPNFESNAFLRRVRAFLTLKIMPEYMMHLYAEFSPVDLTARGVLLIAQYSENETVFHLYNNRPLYFERMIPMLRDCGFDIKTASEDDFRLALNKTNRDDSTRFIYEALENDLDQSGKLSYESNIRIKNDITVWYLSKIGFQWPETDEKYLRAYIEYFREKGFFDE